MKNLTDEQANRLVLANLKGNTHRTFNESGIHFDADVWAFPGNRKIFIGMYDYPMNDKTLNSVKRAMFHHNLTQNIKNPKVIMKISMLLVLIILCGVAVHSLSKQNKSVNYKFEHRR